MASKSGHPPAQMVMEGLSPTPVPAFLEELGFGSLKQYTNYVQSLNASQRATHSAEVLSSYLVWGE
ncbi:MAG: hypothetical protein KDA20_10515 [Phycisphaerales bacterium]|nr:hypothetical protein [Phycisphaerales bacterium]